MKKPNNKKVLSSAAHVLKSEYDPNTSCYEDVRQSKLLGGDVWLSDDGTINAQIEFDGFDHRFGFMFAPSCSQYESFFK